jgi:immune inhibitor A
MRQNRSKYTFGRTARTILVITGVLILGVVAQAMPPSPTLIEANAKARSMGQAAASIPSTSELHDLGIDTPEDCFGLHNRVKKAVSGGAQAVGPFRVLALLVDFSDRTSQVTTGFFDTLVFGNGSGTVHNYFDEISNTQIDLITVNLPSTTGWKRAPSTYAYYVNNAYGLGTYPHNSQKLVEDLVTLVDGTVDFSPYDNDGDGDVDVLLVIHAGTGAELSGSTSDIWSHKWGITPKMTGDGVYVSAYTVQPEFWNTARDMTLGVYAHELLHGFGLPDLYDTDNTSNGVGRWCIMSYGSWNGSLGSSPSHPCAWSRIELGITTPVNVTTNITGRSIPSVEGGGSIFRLWTSGAASNEYFLVENRQKTGYDSYLPGAGLLVWHIDDAKSSNTDEWYPGVSGSTHSWVALEQSDGLFELEHKSDQGDAADPWPGSLSRTSFNGASTPSSDAYLSSGTFVGVTNISASAATMTANLSVAIAADVDDENTILPSDFVLAQNYPNPFNPTTNIQFDLSKAAEVSLDVYNLLGQHVSTLFEGKAPAGTSVVAWDGKDDSGTKVASGVYCYRLTASNNTASRKMILLK